MITQSYSDFMFSCVFIHNFFLYLILILFFKLKRNVFQEIFFWFWPISIKYEISSKNRWWTLVIILLEATSFNIKISPVSQLSEYSHQYSLYSHQSGTHHFFEPSYNILRIRKPADNKTTSSAIDKTYIQILFWCFGFWGKKMKNDWNRHKIDLIFTNVLF